jgi:hypothetical protein
MPPEFHFYVAHPPSTAALAKRAMASGSRKASPSQAWQETIRCPSKPFSNRCIFKPTSWPNRHRKQLPAKAEQNLIAYMLPTAEAHSSTHQAIRPSH